MITETAAALVGSITSAALGFGLRAVLNSWLAKRPKQLLAHLPGGKLERLAVETADADQVAQHLSATLALERDVMEALRVLPDVTVFEQKNDEDADFIVESQDQRVAIEVRNNADSLSVARMRRYLSDHKTATQLLVVLGERVPAGTLRQAHDLIDEGRVSFVEVSDQRHASDEILDGLRRVLGKRAVAAF